MCIKISIAQKNVHRAQKTVQIHKNYEMHRKLCIKVLNAQKAVRCAQKIVQIHKGCQMHRKLCKNTKAMKCTEKCAINCWVKIFLEKDQGVRKPKNPANLFFLPASRIPIVFYCTIFP